MSNRVCNWDLKPAAKSHFPLHVAKRLQLQKILEKLKLCYNIKRAFSVDARLLSHF